MDSNQTKDLMDFIALTFNKAVPNSSKLDFYYDELWQIDSNAIDHIKQHFGGLDACPSNTVKVIKAVYQDWLQMQPAYKRQTACATCNGYGLLIREERDIDDGQLYSFTSRCPHCENWRNYTGESTPVAQPDKYQYKPNGNTYNPHRKAA